MKQPLKIKISWQTAFTAIQKKKVLSRKRLKKTWKRTSTEKTWKCNTSIRPGGAEIKQKGRAAILAALFS